MRLTFFLPTLAASVMAVSGAQAQGAAGAPALTSEPVVTQQLAWRCGKNNPQMWGTFGDGCLKARRKAKKDAAELVIPATPETTLMGN